MKENLWIKDMIALNVCCMQGIVESLGAQSYTLQTHFINTDRQHG